MQEGKYITYKHGLAMAGAIFIAVGTALAWADNKYESKETLEGTKEDIRLIKECVLNGKCKPSPP